jgi:hypothetical protein
VAYLSIFATGTYSVIIDNLVGFEAELNGETNGLNTMGSFYYTLGPADVF